MSGAPGHTWRYEWISFEVGDQKWKSNPGLAPLTCETSCTATMIVEPYPNSFNVPDSV